MLNVVVRKETYGLWKVNNVGSSSVWVPLGTEKNAIFILYFIAYYGFLEGPVYI
jgi:hypothetical protein